MKKLHMNSLVVMGLILGLCGVSGASIISYDSNVIGMQNTNWTGVLSVQKFDATMGDLQSVTMELTGTVDGTARFETWQEPGVTDITLNLSAAIQLQRPSGGNLVATIPAIAIVQNNVPASDGVIDWAGSGGKYLTLDPATKTEIGTTILAADLIAFTGIGNIDLNVSALGASNGSGAGNLITWFSTEAGASAKVTYNYVVPEPATAIMLGLGSLALIRKKRKN